MQSDEVMRATAGVDPATLRAIERVYRDWDAALHAKDVEAALALYAEDVRLESPLVRHLTGSDRGVIRGRDSLRAFIRIVFDRTPPNRGHYRSGFFTDGRKLIWEYPRETPDGEQMDFVESMEIADGLIHRHCVYWGWYGVKVIEEDRYHR
jgi:SnoaL-like domain